MKKALIFATAGEVVTGLALLVIPSLVGWLLFGEELAGSCSAGSTCDRHCPDCFRNSLLARSAARRHVDLQRSRHAVSCLPRFSGFDRRFLVAGGCVSRSPVNPSRSYFSDVPSEITGVSPV